MGRTEHPLINALWVTFKANGDPHIAAAQKAYMRGRFEHFGMKMPIRRGLMRPVIKDQGWPTLDEVPAILRNCWAQNERDFQYVGLDIVSRHARKVDLSHLPLAEELILSKSWWDTVDHVAVHMVGSILLRHPQEAHRMNELWMESDELWLMRTALIFQLNWKERTDAELLFGNCGRLASHPDFFIRKGIGWALRQYGRTDPVTVKAFVARTPLSALSTREALKHLG